MLREEVAPKTFSMETATLLTQQEKQCASNKVEQTWAVSSHSKYRACNIKGASGDAKKHKISRNAL